MPALGFYFHLAADFAAPAQSLLERFIYGAPVFAPLLFSNLAVLAALGLAALLADGRRGEEESGR